MSNSTLFAEPWWVNLLILVPFIAYFVWRKKGELELAKRTLIATALFGIALGFIEAAVVFYIRASLGLVPGYEGTFSDIIRLAPFAYEQMQAIKNMPQSFLALEFWRELATMVVLLSVSYLTAAKLRERCAVFLWTFAAWDIFYYVDLWLTTRWPQSFLSPDVLFLIPIPWLSQVWFPILVSVLSMTAVLVSRK